MVVNDECVSYVVASYFACCLYSDEYVLIQKLANYGCSSKLIIIIAIIHVSYDVIKVKPLSDIPL